MIPFTKISEVRDFLKQHLPVTRLIPAPSISRLTGASVFLKLESELPTGSFKSRGALYALHATLSRWTVTEVIASSTGNHGAAVAYAAKLLRVRARIFLPENANAVKRAKIADLGAEIVEEGSADLAGAYQRALEYSQKRGVYFLDDATDTDLPAGPATIACEIFEQCPSADVIFVPVGDTALIRGVASAAKHLSAKVRIVGVQAERAPSYYLSWKQGRSIGTETCDTIADGLATRTPESANVAAIRELVDDVLLVSEEEMLRAVSHLLLQEHTVAEPSGAAATAAVLKSNKGSAQHIVALVTGANITPEILRRSLCDHHDER